MSAQSEISKTIRKDHPNIWECSAPGKVLAVGGYLVLERPNAGLVISTTARFRCQLKTLSVVKDLDQPTEKRTSPFLIRVRSPQFRTHWEYHLVPTPNRSLRLVPREIQQSSNPYIERSILYAFLIAFYLFGRREEDSTKKKDTPFADSFFEVFLVACAERRPVFTVDGSDAVRKEKGKDVVEGRGIELCVLGDNAFYSQADRLTSAGLPRTRAGLRKLPAHAVLVGDALHALKKTGLGSSAALTTAVLSSLCSFLQLVEIPLSQDSFCGDDDGTAAAGKDDGEERKGKCPLTLEEFHRLAQLSHCVAQGKIGSGFDIASAVYGTQRYVRFSRDGARKALETCCALPTSEGPAPDHLVSLLALSCAQGPASASWNSGHQKFHLPRCLRLMLADVTGGSNTVALVKKVLAWRSTPASNGLWQQQARANERVELALRQLVELETQVGELRFTQMCARLARDSYTVWQSAHQAHSKMEIQSQEEQDVCRIRSALIEIRKSFAEVRANFVAIGKAAGVEIEPPLQTHLLNATEKLPGVLLCGVPGAGGYDAAFTLLIHPDAEEAVESMWSQYQDLHVLSLDVAENREAGGGAVFHPLH